jgi:hypothetical protein
MFDYDSKLRALVENYGLALLLEQNDITEERVIEWLVDEKLIDLEDYFNMDAELEHWKELEQ